MAPSLRSTIKGAFPATNRSPFSPSRKLPSTQCLPCPSKFHQLKNHLGWLQAHRRLPSLLQLNAFFQVLVHCASGESVKLSPATSCASSLTEISRNTCNSDE